MIQLFDLSSRVKLAVNRETQQAIAVKIIDLEKAADSYENVRKEVSSEGIGSFKAGIRNVQFKLTTICFCL